MSAMAMINGSFLGYWFGPGRAMGMHKPWDSKLNKAKDPFINMRTWKRLARSSDDQVRIATKDSLAKKISGGYISFGQLKALFATTNKTGIRTDLLLEAVIECQLTGVYLQKTQQKIVQLLIDFIQPLSRTDREKLAEVKSRLLAEELLKLPGLPRKALIGIIGHHDLAAAYEAVEKTGLSREELEDISTAIYLTRGNPATFEKVLSHPNFDRESLFIIARAPAIWETNGRPRPDMGVLAFRLLDETGLTPGELTRLAESDNSKVSSLIMRHPNCPPEAKTIALKKIAERLSRITASFKLD